MSGEQIRHNCSESTVDRADDMIRQWIPDCWSGDRKFTSPKNAAANSRY